MSVPTIESLDEFSVYLPNFIHHNDTIALLMDFDGTLAPITQHPRNTVIPKPTSEILNRLCNNSHVFAAIISGRGITDVKGKVGIEGIVYAGNHGLEILYSDGKKYDHYIPNDVIENFTKMFDVLRDEIEKDGTWIENKKTSLTVHYREAPEEEHDAIVERATQIIEYHGYTANPAHKAIEAKPPVQWNKGKAAELILQSSFGDNWHEKVKAVFVGDDTTDEDAMRALHGKAVSFRVSSAADIETSADFRLPSTENVHQMLQWIASKYE